MTKRKPARLPFLLSVLSLILLPAKVCFANPFSLGEYIESAFIVVGIDLAVDAAVLIIAYSILRRFDIITSWEFVKYVFIVMVAGLVIDLLCSPALGSGVIIYTLVAFAILSFYNYTFSRSIFDLTGWEALVIGICMGIFTNPVVSIIIFEQQNHGL